MPAIVDDDIQRRDLLLKLIPEISVGLIADKNSYILSLILFAGRFDIYAENLAPLAEIITPHVEAAAAVYSDFENAHFAPPEAAQMVVVDVKIMIPFPYPRALFPRLEKGFQGIWTFAWLGLTLGAGPFPKKAPCLVAAPEAAKLLQDCGGPQDSVCTYLSAWKHHATVRFAASQLSTRVVYSRKMLRLRR